MISKIDLVARCLEGDLRYAEDRLERSRRRLDAAARAVEIRRREVEAYAATGKIPNRTRVVREINQAIYWARRRSEGRT